MSDRKKKALRIIGNMQTLSDELAKLAKHPDEYTTSRDLQIKVHDSRRAFETQINNDEQEGTKDNAD